MSNLSKKLAAAIAALSAGLAAFVGAKGGLHINIYNNCIGFCARPDTASAAKPRVVAEDSRHHVELLSDGRYLGRDRSTGEQIVLEPNSDRKSWSNKGHLYELVSETMGYISIRITFPDGHQQTVTLTRIL